MYNEFVGDCKRCKTAVKVFLTNGGCITGRIDQMGDEAIVMVVGGRAGAHHEERHRQHLRRQRGRAMR